MLGPVDWRIVVVGFGALLFGAERLIRWIARPATLSLRAITVAQLSLGLLCVAYGTVGLMAPYLNAGLAFWHAMVGPLMGSVEVLVLTLRHDQVARRAVHRVLARAGAVTTFLLVTWLPAFAFVGPVDITRVRAPITLALVLHELVFHGYVVWGLSKIVALAAVRVPRDIKRRPAQGVALLLVAAGAVGFTIMNLLIPIFVFTGRDQSAMDAIIAPNVAFLALFVVGSALLALGERIQDEVVARYRLRQLRNLWARVIELSSFDLRLPAHLPAPDQLQRAYVEILDGLSTLRVQPGATLTAERAADVLRTGTVTDDAAAPSISQALPDRLTRREDIDLVHDIAQAYRSIPKRFRSIRGRPTQPLAVLSGIMPRRTHPPQPERSRRTRIQQ